MSEVLDMQVYSLLARMHEARDQGCTQLHDAAVAQAQEIIADARSRARHLVKEAVIEKRRRVEEHCRRVRVEIEAQRRDERFAKLGQRLAEGLALLPAALVELWADTAGRRVWCQHVLDGAGLVLSAGNWKILVAPGLDEDERRALGTRATALAGEAVAIEEAPDLAAGLVVVHDGTRYDGSPLGLLSDRNSVQAALLAELAAVEQPS